MNYAFETLSEEDQSAVVRDAGEKFGNLYRARGGYFRRGVPYEWVVDRTSRSYLIDAPMLAAKRDNVMMFHLLFDDVMYSVQLVGTMKRTIQLVELPPEPQRDAFRAALIHALEVLGYRYAHFPS